jgi:hypothetical protein
MQNFELYDSLKKQVESVNNNFDYNTICNTISNTDSKKAQTVLALILYHYNLEDSKFKNIPYSGKILNDSKDLILFTFNNLPPILKNIISLFIFSVN